MLCPLCKAKLIVLEFDSYNAYACANEACANDDMPRYIAEYNNYPTYLISRALMIDKYHILINYPNNKTTISVLEACILLDPVVIPKALYINLKDPYSIINKLKTLMLFS
jgi:hypothetical protein